MQRVSLNNSVSLSRIIHGYWRLQDWNFSPQELLSLAKEASALGITSLDHADIYGNYSCEAAFGEALKIDPSFRNNIELITKCGIMLKTGKFPDRTIKHYDYSAAHIIASAEQSLKNLHTDRIDVLLLHRPSPFFNAEEVAGAFDKLYDSGKVLSFGVSNFNPIQFELLQTFSKQQLVTNQVEISPYALEHFDNNNLDFLQMKKVAPMAWSPLAGGSMLQPKDEKGEKVLAALKKVGDEVGIPEPATVAYAWLLMHPSGILPVCGTGKIARLQQAVNALDINISLEQWFSIYTASTGVEVP